MNVDELYDLTQWIEREIVVAEVPQRYQELLSVFQANTQPNQPKQPFDAQKTRLIAALQSVPLDRLTADQLKFLERMSIASHVGPRGVEALEDMLYKNVIDVATSATKLQQVVQDLNAAIQRKNQIQTGLSGCIDETERHYDEVLLRVVFAGDASMKNVVAFKNWGTAWFDIGRGIAMAHNASPEDVKIVGATKGSIIIELLVAYPLAKTVSTIILEVLKVAERVLDIRKKAEEIRGLKLTNDKVAGELEKEAEAERENGKSQITDQAVKQLQLKDDQGDVIKALDKAVTNLVDFVEKGGEVDVVLPEEPQAGVEGADESKQAINELKANFAEIRRLESNLRLLEHKQTPKAG